MLNYISAELYKLRRHKGLWIAMGLLFLLESWMLHPAFWVVGISRGAMYTILTLCMGLGLFLAPIFAAVTFDDQHGRGTLKNEIVFGIPRSRVYLGKLLAAALAGTAVAAVLVGWFFLVTFFTSAPMGAEVEGDLLGGVGKIVLCHYLTWLSVLSLTFACLTCLRSAAAAIVIIYLILCFGTPMALIGAGETSPFWYRLAVDLFFAAPLRSVMEGASYLPNVIRRLVGGSAMAYAGLICAAWVGGASAVGLAVFSRQEIK